MVAGQDGQRREKRCSFGGCRVNIGGSNSGSISLLADEAQPAPTTGPTQSSEGTMARTKRCSFGGCSVTIGRGGSNSGSIRLLTEPSEPSANLLASGDALLTRNKRCNFAGCSVHVGGNNSGSIKMLHENNGLAAAASSPEERSTEASAETKTRSKRCSFGDCTVIIGGRNTGTITRAHHMIEGAAGGADVESEVGRYVYWPKYSVQQ
ncbi:uncharacterized protein LOC113212292 isoform X1 [Frankliniella occidentalis]|uniref:Uncharacterized protein LOC113212292 isoform X1 n=1 Tax=Frankliniella occidentalis TaxID=133901 RepID=A0A9C6X412_FRAOC|nr:uncharacterized protein LOC113212292 isoform X1 [Frankliniella occidentalis]